MRSAVDSSVLLDILSTTSEFGSSSGAWIRRALSEGSLVACDVVWAETRAHFPDQELFEQSMERLQVVFDPCDQRCASLAGEAWRAYRAEGGPRRALVPDFLVAAHAVTRADRLITRDRGFARRYFRDLTIADPSEPR